MQGRGRQDMNCGAAEVKNKVWTWESNHIFAHLIQLLTFWLISPLGKSIQLVLTKSVFVCVCVCVCVCERERQREKDVIQHFESKNIFFKVYCGLRVLHLKYNQYSKLSLKVCKKFRLFYLDLMELDEFCLQMCILRNQLSLLLLTLPSSSGPRAH